MINRFYSLGLIGYPLEHSFSPAMHNAALRASRLEGEYKAYPVPPLPGGIHELIHVLDQLRKGEIQGLNVTIPHKRNALPYLDQLSPVAKAIGAVNTLYRQENLLIGDNTDVAGFYSDLLHHMERDHLEPASGLIGGSANQAACALVLGAGGAARAVIYALARGGWKVFVASRRINQAQEIISTIRDVFTASEIQAVSLNESAMRNLSQNPVLVVNTTPVGMYPKIEDSPWPENLPLPKDAFIYDLVYNPLDTNLLMSAKEAGLPHAGGIGMLIEQAALSFELWTGVPASREAMAQAIVLEIRE